MKIKSVKHHQGILPQIVFLDDRWIGKTPLITLRRSLIDAVLIS